MLDFIYYPVSFILWCWHKVFGFVFGESTAVAWILGIIFLTFTVRGIMFKPFVNQFLSMKKMQDFAPEMKKIQKKYANDRQRQAAEMQKLQKEHGVNPLGSCLPMLLQIPVFIGLNHVLRAFTMPARCLLSWRAARWWPCFRSLRAHLRASTHRRHTSRTGPTPGRPLSPRRAGQPGDQLRHVPGGRLRRTAAAAAAR